MVYLVYIGVVYHLICSIREPQYIPVRASSSILPKISSSTKASCSTRLRRHTLGVIFATMNIWRRWHRTLFRLLGGGVGLTKHGPPKRPTIVTRIARRRNNVYFIFLFRFFNKALTRGPMLVYTMIHASSRRLQCVRSIFIYLFILFNTQNPIIYLIQVVSRRSGFMTSIA